MTQSRRITDPNQLSTLVAELPGMTEPDSEAQPITLVLLQPLARADMLAACRNPASRVMRGADGKVVGPSNHEILDIQPLSSAWREALNAIAPLPSITFDMTLPHARPQEADTASLTSSGLDQTNDSFQEVYWETTIPDKGGIGVLTLDAWNLAVTIATVAKIRVKDRCPVLFNTVHDNKNTGPKEGFLRGLEGLDKRLAALSNWNNRSAHVES